MPEITEAYDFHGRTVVDSQGEKIGKVDELYYDEQGGQPEWALVPRGSPGGREACCPRSGRVWARTRSRRSARSLRSARSRSR
jgi:sporulation protein YlmC with PRC-barrel domain